MAAVAHENIWHDKKQYEEAERQYHERLAKQQNSCGIPKLPITVNPTVKAIPVHTNLLKKSKYAKSNQIPQQTVSNPKSPKKSRKCKKGESISVVPKAKSVEKECNLEKNKHLQDSNEKIIYNSNKIQKVESVLASDKHQPKCPKIQIIDLEKPSIDNKKVINTGGAASYGEHTSLASEVAKARQHIKNSLECMESVAALAGVPNVEVYNKINSLEKENTDLKKVVEDLKKLVLDIQKKVLTLESNSASAKSISSAPAPAKPAPAKAEESDDGVDLFASDSEEDDEEAAKIREERLAAYAAKKSKKPVLIAKSNIILDVKPWDDETDMKVMEASVRQVQTDGLLWGAAKLVPLAYGIHKLQISCVVEDDKVSVDWLQEQLESIEDYVQSVDIAAFNKV